MPHTVHQAHPSYRAFSSSKSNVELLSRVLAFISVASDAAPSHSRHHPAPASALARQLPGPTRACCYSSGAASICCPPGYRALAATIKSQVTPSACPGAATGKKACLHSAPRLPHTIGQARIIHRVHPSVYALAVAIHFQAVQNNSQFFQRPS